MNSAAYNELKRINKIVSVSDRYTELRKLYCSNTNEDVIGISYATLLASFSDNSYLKRAIKICNRILSNKSSVYHADARLIIYQINKKISDMNVAELSRELSCIKSTNPLLKRKISFEYIQLLEDTYKEKNLDINSQAYIDLTNKYTELIKSCSPTEHFLRNSACNRYISLLMSNNQYTSVLEIINYMHENGYDLLSDLRRTEFYVKYKLGLLKKDDYLNIGYFERQVLNYSEEEAIKHLSKHIDNNYDYDGLSTFSENTDIERLFYDVQSFVNRADPVEVRCATNVYHIYTDKPVGFIGKQPATVIEVITEAGTKNIHTMYPIIVCSNNLIKNRNESFIKVKKRKL